MRTLLAAIFLAIACQGAASEPIHWDDGDSGKIEGERFRLADVDAPESRSMNARYGAARCEAERLAGLEAKRFVSDLTSSGALKFEWNGETDRHKRKVGDITVDGQSVSAAALNAGHLRPWEHDGSRQLMPKPDWCAISGDSPAQTR